MTVVIGVDPHKRSHTAVVIDHDEIPLATVQVRAGRTQLEELLAWAGDGLVDPVSPRRHRPARRH